MKKILLIFVITLIRLTCVAQIDTIYQVNGKIIGDVFYVSPSLVRIQLKSDFEEIQEIKLSQIKRIGFYNSSSDLAKTWDTIRFDIKNNPTKFQSAIIGPEIGDNLIKIKTGLTKTDNYRQIGEYLINKGYSLENADGSFLTIMTGPKNSFNNKGKNSAINHKLNVQCNDYEIIIRPSIEVGANFRVFYVRWVHANSVDMQGGFHYMHWYNNFKSVIETYPNALEIRYLKE